MSDQRFNRIAMSVVALFLAVIATAEISMRLPSAETVVTVDSVNTGYYVRVNLSRLPPGRLRDYVEKRERGSMIAPALYLFYQDRTPSGESPIILEVSPYDYPSDLTVFWYGGELQSLFHIVKTLHVRKYPIKPLRWFGSTYRRVDYHVTRGGDTVTTSNLVFAGKFPIR